MNVEGTTYYIPHIYGFAHMREVGSPMLPAKNHHIAIPVGSRADIEITDVQFKEYSQEDSIHPALEPAPDCEGCPEPAFEINRGVYETDADFPGKLVEVIDTDTYMGAPIAVIQVRPLQFNPVTKKLKVYSKIKFNVTFSGGERSFNRFTANSEHANQMVRNAVLNRGAIPRGVDSNENFGESTRNGRKDYIMIVHSNYLAAAEALATWKRQMGYSVEIVSQSSWTTTQVKNELQTRYDSWTPKPLFFLIFGDQGDVPAEYTSRYTDLYYAEMEGSGYKPEMAYGRIFPSSASNAQVIVDKIINYEKNPPTLSSFYTNALACAYYQDNDLNSYADRRFTHTSEDIRNHLMGLGYGVNRVYVTGSSVDPLYYNNGNYSPPNTPIPNELKRPTFAWDGDYNDIINYIDAGRFLVWHRDHGDVTLWGDPYFTTSHINQLNNGNLLPIIMSVNCLTGQFTGSTECFCERFLRKDTGGCVGIFGATNLSYSGPNDGYAPGIIDAIWPDPQIDPQYRSGGAGNPIPAHDPIYTMGDILNHSKVAMEYLWGTHQTTWELHHYYGDPAMKIWTAVPTTTTASHPSSLPKGATSLSITSSNCGGGIATLVYEDILMGKTTLAGDGTGTITFDPLSGNESTAILTVSKHNYKPYIANISVASGPPTAAFTSDTVSVMAGGVVNFTDQSSGGPTSWSWTFEGGTPSSSTTQNPTITYSTAGTYNVSLTAANAAGNDTETKTDYITVQVQPLNYCSSQGNNWSYEYIGNVTVGSFSNDSGAAGYTDFTYLTIDLTAGDTVNVSLTPVFPGSTYTEYWKIWIDHNIDGDFEDAGEEVFSDVSSTTVTGNFTVPSSASGLTRMRVSMKWNGWPTPCETFSYGEVEDYTVDISGTTPQPPEADFTASATVITEGQTVNFTDLSTNNPTSWSWTFNGGTPSSSTAQNPAVTYYTAGVYPVELTATNAYGSDTETKVNYITVNPAPAPVANFTASATTINVGESVTFTDQSTNNPTSWSWSFEGGTPSSSTAQNPTVQYNTAGTFDVSLTAANAAGSDEEFKANYITVNPPSADEIAEAVDNTSLTFTHSGNADWYKVTDVYYYGGDSARSGDIGNNQSSTIETTVTVGSTQAVKFYWKVSSEANYDYLRFYIDGVEKTRIAGTVDWTQVAYNITAGTHTLKWSYTKDYSVSTGYDCGWVDKLEITEPVADPIAEAVDYPSLTFSLSGNANWFSQTTTTYYGGDAAQSGDIGNNQTSTMETTISGKTSVKFYWKVSSESNYDYLRFYIDGVEQNRISGNVNWTQRSYSVSSGTHTLKWSYTKDYSVSSGSDCGWVDKLELQ